MQRARIRPGACSSATRIPKQSGSPLRHSGRQSDSRRRRRIAVLHEPAKPPFLLPQAIDRSLLSHPTCPPPAMYIRVKRNKTTYFIQCDPTETTLSIKQKLHSLIDQPPSNQQLILLSTTEVVLDDSKTLADQKVENDAVIALTLRKDDNVFEEVSIARPEDFMSSS